ncbi:hypothetical protein N9815_00155 [Flavobacteriales bacterium]|jgi:hypothetical protein|nr:hypothetical protein [Flavobacteriales bacterium]
MKYLFEENQKFTQWWLWVILLSFPISSFGPFDENTININYVLIGFFIPFLFYLFELRLKVSAEGLHYQFFPFHLKSHIIKLEDIEKFKAMEYSPLKEYGGWGIKYGFKGKAYNVSGNKGVKIFLNNGTNIMFGSLKNSELVKAMKMAKQQ